jgi:hypothetical protein
MDDDYILRGHWSCMNDFYCPWVGISKSVNIGLYSANIGDSEFKFRDITDKGDYYILCVHCHA